MDNLTNNKEFNFLKWIFILFSLVFVVYTTITMRALYMDGAFFMIEQLNNLSNGIYQIHTGYSEHPRYIIAFLSQFPLWICNFIGLSGKKFLLMLYSFTTFFLPLLILYWNYRLTLKTKRIDVFFWHLLTYSLILITFSIFSCVEIYIGAGLQFILWNYLVSDTEIKKRDALALIVCLICLFATYEYIIFLGPIIFCSHFHYVLQDKSIKNQYYKTLIGLGSLGAAIYNIYFMINVQGEGGEIARFFKECHDYLPYIFQLCSLFSVITIIFLLIFVWKKTKINRIQIIIMALFYVLAFHYLITIPIQSIYPMWEGHFRSIPCWAIPLIFIIMSITDRIRTDINYQRYTNLICIVLLCGIVQTLWQINNTYYWNKNIIYMKEELAKTNELLYIPTEHEEMSGFHNEELRRYIWHGVFTPTSILFSDNYEQKTLLMTYDVQPDPGNVIDRSALYVRPDNSGKMSVSFGSIIDIKNKYWDLTKCAKALDEYNKKNNIQTRE